jgi:transposase-like protein
LKRQNTSLGSYQKGEGNVVAQVVPNTKQKTLNLMIKKHVEKGSNLYSDE